MNVRVIQGIGESQVEKYGSYYKPLGAIQSSSQVSANVHRRNKIVLSVPRGIFMGMVRANVFGLGSIINATRNNTRAFAYWNNSWYNLGGDNNKLFSNASIGKNKKAILIQLAPQPIKEALFKVGISGNILMAGAVVHDQSAESSGDKEKKSLEDWAKLIEASAVILSQLMPLIVGSTNLASGDINSYTYGTGGVSPIPMPNNNTSVSASSGVVMALLLGAGIWFGLSRLGKKEEA